LKRLPSLSIGREDDVLMQLSKMQRHGIMRCECLTPHYHFTVLAMNTFQSQKDIMERTTTSVGLCRR